jgi:hypothetical protein
MALAMTRPWKHPKTGVYWLRKRVPLPLQHVVGKQEEKRSLKTKYPLEPKTRLLRELTELEERWANLTKGPVVLTEVETHQLAQSVYAEWIRIYKDNPRDQRYWNTEIGVEGVWEMPPSIFPAHLIQAYSNADYLQEQCFNTADDILTRLGLTVDEKSRPRLAWAVSAAMQRASLKLKEMALGGTASDEKVLRLNASVETSAAQPSHVSITELVNGWVAEKHPREEDDLRMDARPS